MSGKKIDVQAGGKWAKFDDGSGMVHRQADGRVRLLGKYGIDAIISETSISGKLFDLPTPDALAQLREWGYVVRGEATRPTHGVTYGVSSCDAMPNGTVIETTYSLPIGYATFTALTESRVREIVEQVMKSALDKLDDYYDRRCDSLAVRMDNMDHALASLRSLQEILSKEVDELQRAHPTPAEVREAIVIANDPNTKWHDVTEPDADPDFNGKEAVAPEPTADELLRDLVKLCDVWAIESQSITAAREHLARTNGGGK